MHVTSNHSSDNVSGRRFVLVLPHWEGAPNAEGGSCSFGKAPNRKQWTIAKRRPSRVRCVLGSAFLPGADSGLRSSVSCCWLVLKCIGLLSAGPFLLFPSLFLWCIVVCPLNFLKPTSTNNNNTHIHNAFLR